MEYTLNMDTTISIRTNSIIKNKAIKILNSRGLSLSTALNMYLSDLANKKTFPVSDMRYVKDSIVDRWEREFQYAKKYGKSFSNLDDLMKDLLN